MALLVPSLLALAAAVFYGLYRFVLFLVHVWQSRPAGPSGGGSLGWTVPVVIVCAVVFQYVFLYMLGWIVLAVGRKVSGNPSWGALPESEASNASG